ncbi:class I SAM-dependent methyltransferase [Erythrobacter alti]|uniref:class I SAM-dependent methyltransferase n=1 Tax=Erythrobacter alti TaxID=1896145 RepID=UPI0030F3E175
MSDLAATFRRLIASTGPISLAHYMAESNAHYYAEREAIGGKAADFITAPEVSQMFGELVGLWLTDIWQRAGSPVPVHYVELGPGRGTLAKDALRVMARQGLVPQVHLVETSARLREAQGAAVPGAIHHDDLSTIPSDGAILLVANEFLDALPVRQLVRTDEGWRDVMVALGGSEEFIEVPGRQPMDAVVPHEHRDAQPGTVIETSPACAAIVTETASRLATQGGAALFIDYGHADGRTGSSLQAVRGHEKLGVFDAPGEADLSAHVDFAQMERVAAAQDCRVLGTVTQGPWLTALGIDQRAHSLAQSAPQQAEAVMGAKDRLTAPEQMGELFKVMGLAAPDWPDGAGFAEA